MICSNPTHNKHTPRNMTEIGSNRVREIFVSAVRLSGTEREQFLQNACGDDSGLRADVERLLAHDSDASENGFLEGAPRLEGSLESGQRVDSFEVRKLIGEGGMGEVYLAEQTEPVRRNVALKLIKLGMDSKSVLARFEIERQALAMMNHPGIAKIYDAGTTDRGQPYFAMEHIEGLSITRFCDTSRATTNERISLFLDVCDAIQHAHQKGVVHRDLKPPNILVTGKGASRLPKVIDFGLARAIEGPLSHGTAVTERGQLLGTPEYMSPEQLSGVPEDIDTRTDVYSLGVVLYELLAGTCPFPNLRDKSSDEMRRRIREVDPVRPSIRVATSGNEVKTIARLRRTQARKLASCLRGELDWITMKAIEKDRDRRYQTVAELIADLRRFQNGEPVAAGPPSTAYRVRKFVRRHRTVVAAAILVAASIVAALIATTLALFEARDSKDKAEHNAREAQRNLNNFQLFSHSDPPGSRRRRRTIALPAVARQTRCD